MKMTVEEVKGFVELKIGDKLINSNPALKDVLKTIPGIQGPLEPINPNVPLAKYEEDMKNNLVILTGLFEGGPEADSIELVAQYPWDKDIPLDYQIGFLLGDKFAPIAGGRFSDIVKWLNK